MLCSSCSTKWERVQIKQKYKHRRLSIRALISSLHSSTCFSLSLFSFHPSLRSFFFCLTSPGQQEDEEDAGGGAASEERAGEGRPESSEEPERPDLG